MNLEELKNTIDFEIANLNGKDPKDIKVLITLDESNVGARSSSKIKNICMGFDWENGQLRIEPDTRLVRKGNSLTDVKAVICKEYDGRKYYVCYKCGSKLSKNDIYCRCCGQRLK